MKNNNGILVFDTDPGLDDATALLLLSRLDRYPDYVVATYGNAPVETTYRNAVVLTRNTISRRIRSRFGKCSTAASILRSFRST